MNKINPSKDEIFESAASCGAFLDEPLGDRGIVSQRIISQFAKERVTVCLSGDGADELFGGYDRYQKLDLSRAHMESKFEKSHCLLFRPRNLGLFGSSSQTNAREKK